MSWQEELKQNIRSIDSFRRYYPKLQVQPREAANIENVIRQRGINIPKRYLEDLITSAENEEELEQIRNVILPRTDILKTGSESTITLIEDIHLDTNPVMGLTQMYPDRVLVSPNYSCMNNCQWCFRNKESKTLSEEDLKKIYDYIAKHPKIRDVILTGGEPLLTSDGRLEDILKNLRDILNIDIIRFHTRAPVVLPSRIDDPFLKVLKKYKKKSKPIYIVTQFVHPNELSEESTDAVYRLVESGIIVLNQTPILRGINDNQETFDKLNQKLIKYQIKPYYAIAPIVKNGVNNRFYTSFEKIENLVNEYSSKYDGLGRPTLIVPVMGKKLTPPQLKDSMEKYRAHIRNTKREI